MVYIKTIRGTVTVGIGHLVYETQIQKTPCTQNTIKSYNQKYGTAGLKYEGAQGAYALFLSDIQRVSENPLNKNLKVKITQGEFDALVDLVFNVGEGNLLKNHPQLINDINAGHCDPQTIKNDFLLFGGDPNRRLQEADQFNSS